MLLHSRSWRAEAVIGALVASDRYPGSERPHAGARAADTGTSAARGGGRRTLLVCVASRVEEIEALLCAEKLPFVRYEGSAAKRRAALASGLPVVLCTYGMLVSKDVLPPLEVAGSSPGWRVRKGAPAAQERQMRSALHVPR